jgi:hypothetical protein
MLDDTHVLGFIVTIGLFMGSILVVVIGIDWL